MDSVRMSSMLALTAFKRSFFSALINSMVRMSRNQEQKNVFLASFFVFAWLYPLGFVSSY